MWESRFERFPVHPPRTREYYLLRSIFETHFPHPDAIRSVPQVGGWVAQVWFLVNLFLGDAAVWPTCCNTHPWPDGPLLTAAPLRHPRTCAGPVHCVLHPRGTQVGP